MAETDSELVDRLAKRHSVSPAAVQVVMTALRNGGGRMAQFSHADFGGMSQWSPGMSMVGDMFNAQLKSKLDALCTDIAAHLEQSELAGGGARAAEDGVSFGRCRDRPTGGLPDRGDLELWARKTTSATQSSLRPDDWSWTTTGPSHFTIPAIIGYSESLKLKAATKPFRSPARTAW